MTKIRGGATANPTALVEARVPERMATMAEEKRAIAAHAARLLAPGQTVFIDDSTTAMAMVPHVIACAPITVATNFLPVVGKLAGVAGVELVVLGGVYHSVSEASFGSRTVESIGQLHADLALISTTGITGVSCYHRSEMTVTSRMAFLANASTKVLLADHAKFGRPATYLLGKLTMFDLVVTDTGIDPEDEQLLRAEGVRLEVAGPLPHHTD